MTSSTNASSTVPVNPLAVRRSMIFVLIMRTRFAVVRSFALIAAVSCSRSWPSRFVDIVDDYHDCSSGCDHPAAAAARAPRDEMNDRDDHRGDDQQVNRPCSDVERGKAEYPENRENDGNCEQH